VPLLALDLLAAVVARRVDARRPFSALLTLWLSMIAAVGLDRVDIQRVQMNALMMDSMDMNALGVCS